MRESRETYVKPFVEKGDDLVKIAERLDSLVATEAEQRMNNGPTSAADAVCHQDGAFTVVRAVVFEYTDADFGG